MNYVFIIFSKTPNTERTLCNVKYGLKELTTVRGTSYILIWTIF